MVTASFSLPATRAARTPFGERVSATGAAVLSIGGTILAIGIAAVGVLVIPVAAIVAFGPALLALF